MKKKDVALRNWYLAVKKEFDKLGVKCSRFKPALFFWHFKNELLRLLYMQMIFVGMVPRILKKL